MTPIICAQHLNPDPAREGGSVCSHAPVYRRGRTLQHSVTVTVTMTVAGEKLRKYAQNADVTA